MRRRRNRGPPTTPADTHGVGRAEAEQAFFNEPLLVVPDLRHSREESRYHALRATDERRLLHITFTLRAAGTLIREGRGHVLIAIADGITARTGCCRATLPATAYWPAGTSSQVTVTCSMATPVVSAKSRLRPSTTSLRFSEPPGAEDFTWMNGTMLPDGCGPSPCPAKRATGGAILHPRPRLLASSGPCQAPRFQSVSDSPGHACYSAALPS